MKFSKFVVLAAGLIGLIAFFLPLISVKDSGVKGAISAFQIVKGIDSASDVVDQAGAEGTAADRAVAKDANEALGKVKGIVLALFVPALLLTALGALGTAKKRFGRGLGAGALVFGIIGLLIGLALNSAASDGGESSAGIALHLMTLAGIGGLVGGLLALIKPDRGIAAAA